MLVPNYFFGFAALEAAKKIMIEMGITPISISAVEVKASLWGEETNKVPALFGVREEEKFFLLFGAQWGATPTSRAGAEWLLLPEPLEREDGTLPPLEIEGGKVMEWNEI
jgi:hypothetical protein